MRDNQNHFPTVKPMNTARQHQPTPAAFLRVFDPTEEAGMHRIEDPVQRWPQRKPPVELPPENPTKPGVSDRVLAIARTIAATTAQTTIPEDQKPWIRDHLSLREFFETYLQPEREKRIREGTLTPGTLQKDRQALNRWERFTRPNEADWPLEEPWPGVPVGVPTDLYVSEILARMRCDLGTSTTRSTWAHLRTIFKTAERWGVIRETPKPGKHQADNRPVSVFRPDQLEAGYKALRSAPDLQVAFVLAANIGARAHDLFLLRFADLQTVGDRPTVTFQAKKTGKVQTIPLAPVTVAQVDRLPRDSEYLFPRLTSPGTKDPERSPAARRRRIEMQTLLATAGLRFPKPFQSLRATCNTRLNRVREGSGAYVLGHALTLNARHYTEPSELIWEAVLAVQQPACFWEF